MNNQFNLNPPAEIVDAAEKVRIWMDLNGHKYWQLRGICDRRIVSANDQKQMIDAVTIIDLERRLTIAREALSAIADQSTNLEHAERMAGKAPTLTAPKP